MLRDFRQFNDIITRDNIFRAAVFRRCENLSEHYIHISVSTTGAQSAEPSQYHNLLTDIWGEVLKRVRNGTDSGCSVNNHIPVVAVLLQGADKPYVVITQVIACTVTVILFLCAEHLVCINFLQFRKAAVCNFERYDIQGISKNRGIVNRLGLSIYQNGISVVIAYIQHKAHSIHYEYISLYHHSSRKRPRANPELLQHNPHKDKA